MFMIVRTDTDLLFFKCCSQVKSADQYSNLIKAVFDTAATELFSVTCSIIGEKFDKQNL